MLAPQEIQLNSKRHWLRTLVLSCLLGIWSGCGPTPERVSYDPPPFKGKVYEIRFPEVVAQKNIGDLLEAPSMPPLPPAAQVVVVGKVNAGASKAVGAAVMMSFAPAGKQNLTMGGIFAKATRDNDVVSYRGEIKAPQEPGVYVLQIFGPPDVSYYGRAKVTVTESPPQTETK